MGYFNCPKCKGVVGEGLKQCPDCGKIFTAEDRAAMKKAQEREEKVREEQSIFLLSEYQRKAKLCMDLFIICILMLVIGSPVVGLLTKSLGAAIGFGFLALAGFGGTILYGLFVGGLRCPHCNAIVFRNSGPRCDNCGGKLR